MTQLIIMGTSNAIPAEGHENTHMLLTNSRRKVLIDCATNPLVRMEQVAVNPITISDIILTHFHPDHVSGLPSLVMNMWLMGRREPLNIHGLDYTIDRAEKMMDLFDWQRWPNFYPVNYLRIPQKEKAVLVDEEEMRILASPVKHFLPNICLKFELKHEEKSFVYSCDTEPCEAVVNMASGVDILFHEASGGAEGHTSAAQAGDIARQAGVKALYLIHYPTGRFAKGDLVSEAKANFSGTVRLAFDLMKFNWAPDKAARQEQS